MKKILASVRETWAYLASALVGLAYVAQSLYYAHHQLSVLDEGAYLLKGWLFATGQYAPFQDYGPLTNHMPMAFLLPGWVQAVFGPGLRTGRLFSVALGALMLLGLWLLVRRLRGPWWATAAITAVTANVALVKMYSTGVSQVIVSCLLVWTLFFALGKDRSLAQLITATVLAAVIWLTRINMAPVLLFLLVYIYFQYRWNTAWKCALAGFGVLLLVHLWLWPDILKLWAYWLPAGVTPFLDAWRVPADAVQRWAPEIALDGRINSFLQAVRTSLVPVAGFVAGAVLWKRSVFKSDKSRAYMMLLVGSLFLFLLVLHAGATLTGSYCVYCFQVYLGFFDLLAILFVVLALPDWKELANRWSGPATIVLTCLLLGGVGYAAWDVFSRDWLAPRWVRSVLAIGLPGGLTPGVLVQNKFGLDYTEAVVWMRRFILQLVPVLGGLLLALGILLLAWWLARRARTGATYGFAALAWMLFLAGAVILSPTAVLSGGYTSYDCSGDVIASYEAGGEQLAQVLDVGGLVYWTGGESMAPMLYVHDVEIFPAQINDGYSFYLSGDTETLHRLSYWDEALQTQWLLQADYLLIEDQYYDSFWVDSGQWVETAIITPMDACRPGASIHVLARP